MSSLYLWIKALHIAAVIFWMAGLLYLPRLFVYHSQSELGGELETKMVEAERKLLRIIMNPAMIAAFILGSVMLYLDWDRLFVGFWIYGKLFFVFLLMGFHGYLSKMRKRFDAGERPKSEKFFRMINEIPSFATLIIVVLVIVEPF